MSSPPGVAYPFSFQFKASRQPMLWAAVVYALGILAGTYAWRPASWWVAGGIGFIAAAGYFVPRRPRGAWVLALGTLFLTGSLDIQLRYASPRLDSEILHYADRREINITAHVTKERRVQRGFGELRQALDLECEQIQTEDGQIVPVRSGIRISVYSPLPTDVSPDDADSPALPLRSLHYGDRIRFVTKLRRPRNFRNPGGFDYESYLADRGIAALGSTKAENVEVLSGFFGSRIERLRNPWRASVIAKVHQLWPPQQASLIDAMIVGEEAFIDRDTRTDFQRSGTYHILVVSGMNVSILAFVVFWTARRLRIAEIPATLITVASCAGYALLTEVGAPVWRATLMGVVYLTTRLLYRDRAMTNAPGAAALGLLVLDPRQLLPVFR